MQKVFRDKTHIKKLLERANDISPTTELISRLRELKKDRDLFYLTLDELQDILKWKLRGQFGRQSNRRSSNTNDNIIAITKTAFSVTHSDKDIETILKLKLLSTLSGVEVPIASAILTLCYPENYSVIDFRNWRQVYKTVTRKSNYTAIEYVGYLKIIKSIADKYKMTPQEIDQAMWRKDIEENRSQ